MHRPELYKNRNVLVSLALEIGYLVGNLEKRGSAEKFIDEFEKRILNKVETHNPLEASIPRG